MAFAELFTTPKPLIACIHLQPLPGAPRYQGSMGQVIDTALTELDIYRQHNVNGIIVENFRDAPFYPGPLPAETIAGLTAVTYEIVRHFNGPVGVNALRNDGAAGMAIATAAGARFIRVNVHLHAVVADQGIIQGRAHETLRLRAALNSNVLIFADAGVKHASPLGSRPLADETSDISERGLCDALIVSGTATGAETDIADIETVSRNTPLPLLIGSGATPDNLPGLIDKIDGLIVGSYFKKDGHADNPVDPERVKTFSEMLAQYRTS